MTEQVQDPVCGLMVNSNSPHGPSEYQGQQYWFCSEGCEAKFLHEPGRYVKNGMAIGSEQPAIDRAPSASDSAVTNPPQQAPAQAGMTERDQGRQDGVEQANLGQQTECLTPPSEPGQPGATIPGTGQSGDRYP
ncbi:MAG: YHS domain-containing protein [bacterium]